MRKSLILILFAALMPVLLIACSGEAEVTATEDGSNEAPITESITTASDENTDAPEQETTADAASIPDKDKSYSFLFIGNSYTHYNDMPEQIFAKLLRAAGYKARVTRVTKGGWYLIDSADPEDEVGKQVDNMLRARDFDYVILQEQSTCPILDPGKFYTGVRKLAARAVDHGATPILYGTWGRKTGHSALKENGWTNESMTWMISAAYEAIGAELGIDVAYAGLAFYDVYTNEPGLNIYNDDLTHPSEAGSYLAALTIFAEVMGIDPTTVDYNAGLTDEAAAILKEAARKAVFETPDIPEGYKTASLGVEYTAQSFDIDASGMKNLRELPSSELISVLHGGTYPNGKSFSGILGTKNAIASREYSLSGFTAAQKADIADIGYGVSIIGIERILDSKGKETAIENLVNGHWGSSYMCNIEFDDNKYDIRGEVDAGAPYTGLITLNFGSRHRFDAVGFASGSLRGFPGVAEVFVSDDGKEWTRVPSACWNNVSGTKLISCGESPADPWKGNTAKVTCLFDMGGVSGQYIRIGVVVGRNDEEAKYNTINTRELLVYGEKTD